MITPKDMAQSLVNEFDGVGLQMRNEAIACALICVNRIIDAIDWHEFETPNTELNYWNQVKEEINKL